MASWRETSETDSREQRRVLDSMIEQKGEKNGAFQIAWKDVQVTSQGDPFVTRPQRTMATGV